MQILEKETDTYTDIMEYNENLNYKDKEPEQFTKEEREQKVYQLEVELAESTLEKKSFVSAANENIKRIKAEIKDLVRADVKVLNVS